MSKRCRHPIMYIELHKESVVDRGYGCDDYYDVFYLRCNKCRKQINVSGQYKNCYTIKEHHYEELTERTLSTEEFSQMFEKNNWLFHQLLDNDCMIKKAILESKMPKLSNKIRRQKRLITAAIKKLETMEIQYEGRPKMFVVYSFQRIR